MTQDLAAAMEDELATMETENGRRSVRAKYVALAAANHIESNYRCTAELVPELTKLESLDFTIRITPDYQVADDEYVQRFDRITFDAPVGTCTLELKEHAAFGVCKFNYHEN